MKLSDFVGIPVDRDFTVEGYNEIFRISDRGGNECFVYSVNGGFGWNTLLDPYMIYSVLHRTNKPLPTRFFRKQDLDQLRAILNRGGKYLAKDADGKVHAFENLPKKDKILGIWHTNSSPSLVITLPDNLTVCDAVKRSDAFPLPIFPALTDEHIYIQEEEEN